MRTVTHSAAATRDAPRRTGPPAHTAGAPWLLIRGDVLASARCLPDGCCDLIYADPPFGTGRARRQAEGSGYDDHWDGDADHHLAWLMPRLARMRDLLKPTGSLFVHLDWHSTHAVKLGLDRLFGPELFINEIIWTYRTGGTGRRWLARKHDTILFYARTAAYKFHPLRERSYLSHHYGFSNTVIHSDSHGPYRWARMRDVWEIPALRGNSPERVPFPTQKPLALLRRIVALVTDPGDRVADLCCGSGTTLVAAVEAGRQAIGMDVSAAALAVAAERLRANTRCSVEVGD